MKRAGVILMLYAALMGCVAAPVRDTSYDQAQVGTCGKLDNAAEVQLGLVRQMLEQGQPYAGLAHLAALEPTVRSSAQGRYLQAELLRHTGSGQEAQIEYRGLLGSCLSGYGHHGLGLLAAANRDLQQAVAELRQAAVLLPTDPRIRNDLGYALLLSRDGDAAHREFMTAIELGDYKRRASLNLVLLALYEGDEQGAARLGRRLDLSDAEMEQLRQRALQLHQIQVQDTQAGEG